MGELSSPRKKYLSDSASAIGVYNNAQGALEGEDLTASNGLKSKFLTVNKDQIKKKYYRQHTNITQA